MSTEKTYMEIEPILGAIFVQTIRQVGTIEFNLEDGAPSV